VNFGLHSSLDAAGDWSARFLGLFWLFVIVGGVVFLLVLLMLLWAAFRHRVRGGPPVLVPDPARERRLEQVIGGAVAVTVLILLVFTIASYATDRGLAHQAGEDEIRVDVIGHQWWWEVRYQDPVPSRVFTTANEIHVPVGVPVRFNLSSPDVIHSFWVPSLAGKLDLIPGRENALTLTAREPGTYRGQCAEFCGFQHAHMGLLVIARPPDEFAAWREAQIRPAAAPASEAARRGLEVFLSGPCVMCHAIRGTPAAATLGPDLTHLASRLTLAAATVPNNPGQLAAWIADPQHVKPGNRMPITDIAGTQLAALVAYLGSLE
jgi:cytochrome c oxidase subunit 2